MHSGADVLSRSSIGEMSQNDERPITSTSGQIGFLQQLTDLQGSPAGGNRAPQAPPISVRDTENPPMSEYQALLIDQRVRCAQRFCG